ncbi:MAG: hypothetical protein DBP02_07510 [gamma proteobacterium symbiont of Ctena orbiculata]|nr:MAG: hypothetical protein DBP02_07510 [gamma proteobacterium symbiont of Ctena orbiculata]
MTGADQRREWFIGWDVGGWNCDKNKNSRDAIAILDANHEIVGTPWRGNLRECINSCSTSIEWIAALFDLCGSGVPPEAGPVTLAIDTRLGFSEAFIQLVTQSKAAASIEASNTNPYLFRRTEHYLFEQGLSPLSAIKDMIGSQATKGMHVLARFAPKIVECGVWSDGSNLTAIEAYPSACKRSETIQALHRPYPVLSHADCEDALTCALVASLFAEKRGALIPPEADVSPSEGWIWVPMDAFFQDALPSS